MNSKYKYILFNADLLSKELLEYLLYDLELFCLAVMLKSKFTDNRSVELIQQLIVEEYGLLKTTGR